MDEVLEEIEFFRGKIHRLGIFRNQAFGSIYLQITDVDRCGFIGDIPSSEGAYPRNELFEVEGLPQIVIGSDIEPRNDIFRGVSGSEEENGGVVSLFPEFPTEGQSVLPREVYIEDDDIEMFSGCSFLSHDPIECDFGMEGFESQVFPDILRKYPIIFYDENFHIASRLVCSWIGFYL